MNNPHKLSSIATIFGALGLLSSPLYAVNALASEKVEHIAVTGSHIKRSSVETASPLLVIEKQHILSTGLINVENILQELTVAAGPAGNATNAYWTSNGVGTAQVNLRGLGIKRTLVLVNGKRFVNGGTGANGSVDLNHIPVAIIKRVEVLTDGASAIYGADAIAGVVNIITDRRFEGLELATRIGSSSKGDGDERQISLTFGTSGTFEQGNSWSATMNASYVNNAAVMQSDRFACPLTETEQGLECFGSATTIGGRAHFTDGNEIQFNQQVGGDGDSYQTYDSGVHSFNWFEYLNAVNPAERFNLSLGLEYQLNDSASLYADSYYAKRNGRQIITPRSIRPVDVAADFIYNPTGQDLTLKRRRIMGLGVDGFEVPYFYQKVDNYATLVGIEGELTNDWQYDVSYYYGRNTAVDARTYDIDRSKVAQTLDMSQCSVDAGAAIPCGDYFGAGDLSAQVLDYISFERDSTGGNEMQQLSATLSGDIASLAAGDLAFASGVEFRQEKGWRAPNAVVVANGIEQPIGGEFDVLEAFGEVDWPISNSINASIAFRYSDYSSFGDNNTYKLGLTWQASDQLMLRSVKSTAVRIPSINELYGGTNEENLITIDPCEGASGTILDNCLAAGISADFVQDGSTVRTGVGGNSSVMPEHADTFTLGLVYEPDWLNGLSLTWDYFDIAIDNAIGSVDGSNQLRLCYTDPTLYALYCNGFTRDSVTKQVLRIERKPLNAAFEDVVGWDVNTRYVGEVGELKTRINLDVTRLLKHQNRAFADAEDEILLGKITADRGIYSKYKANLSFGLAAEHWQGSWSIRFIGSADDENGGGVIGRDVPSMSYHDIHTSYQLTDTLTLGFGVDNLFDKKAPYLTSWNDANTDVFSYDLIGRRWYLQVNWH